MNFVVLGTCFSTHTSSSVKFTVGQAKNCTFPEQALSLHSNKLTEAKKVLFTGKKFPGEMLVGFAASLVTSM